MVSLRSNTEDFFATYPPEGGSERRGRAAVLEWLSGWADGDGPDELAVVVSELLANAVAATSDGTYVVVRACRDDDVVVLEVSNSYDGRPTGNDWDLDDLLRSGGRGLVIVRALTDWVELEHRNATTTVRCRKRVEVLA